MFKSALQLLVIFSFCAGQSLVWAGNPLPAGLPESPATGEWACNLPEPGNFHVTGGNGNPVSLAWLPVQDAGDYYLEVRDLASNMLLQVDSTANTSIDLYLTTTMPVLISVAGRVRGCTPSPFKSVLKFVPIIADLIVEHTGAEGDPMYLSPDADGCYTAPWPPGNYIYGFDVILQEQNFAVLSSYEITSPDPEFQFCNGNMDLARVIPNMFYTRLVGSMDGSNWGGAPYCDPQLIHLQRYVGPVLTDWYDIKISSDGGSSAIFCFTLLLQQGGGRSAPSSVLRFWKKYHEQFAPPSVEDRSSDTHPVVADPVIRNPFGDDLLVRMPEEITGTVHFQLFDLNGRPVLDQLNTTAQEYTLPTATLPAGFYVLRVEADGFTRNFKVLKSN